MKRIHNIYQPFYIKLLNKLLLKEYNFLEINIFIDIRQQENYLQKLTSLLVLELKV